MPSTVLANLILCCAAVLLMPQALECCATHPQTVLEGLGHVSANRAVNSSDHHAEMERRERVAEPIDRTITGEQTAPAISGPGMSLPSGHEAGQPPTVGARIFTGTRVWLDLEPTSWLAQRDELASDRVDRPATPPPRRDG